MMIARTLGLLLAATLSMPALAQDYRERLPQDEVIYFVLPDRFENGDPKNDLGGLKGDRLKTGYDPAAKGFYHGGDLNGLTQKLDYLQNLGITAIWFAPIFKNKPVQGPKGDELAGYHGYWVTDFTQVDPHFGTNAEFKAFVDAAHARGMKVYMDIIANHTADVIQYPECDGKSCAYRSIADYPYQRQGGVNGMPINPDFQGIDVRTEENFRHLTNPGFAYTPFVPKAERNVKVPAWLNDPIYYHNRGDSEWWGESVIQGDFSGLDDIMTEHPRVQAGLIEVFGNWIDQFGIDGFRIDTAKHVNPEFWQVFAPAMKARAAAKGIPNFHIFGEVYIDGEGAGPLAVHTRRDKLPALLDFAFFRAMIATLGDGKGTEELYRVFNSDVLYDGGEQMAMQLPTFTSNHDAGRIAQFIKAARPNITQDELLQRVILGQAMILTLRGVPTIYYGDEQGFVSDGGDQLAREDMFPSKVAVYNDNDLLGTDKTTAEDNFDGNNPLFQTIAKLARIRTATPALRRGKQVVRYFSREPGLLAISRFDPNNGNEILLLFNTSNDAISQNVVVETRSSQFRALAGECVLKSTAPGSVGVNLPPLSYAICEVEN